MGNPLRFLPSWGYVLMIFFGLGLAWLVQTAIYLEAQEWTPTWEGSCSAAWEQIPTEEPVKGNDEDKEPTEGLMVSCGEHKIKAIDEFAIDYYRLTPHSFNCTQTQGAFTRNFKWECVIEPNVKEPVSG